MQVLEINNLSKHYTNVQAVRSISISVPKGSIYGILGPNGSGKTSTLGMVLGVINPNSGSYRWFESDTSVSQSRKRIGALLETPNFYPYLSGRKNLEIVAAIKEVPFEDIDRVLEIVDLSDRQSSKFKTYSLGMKQRLAIGAALLGDPEVLVLDEPTNGLDPKGIADVRTLIQREAQRGKTVLLASHIMDEVEKVCTHVAVMKKGKLLAAGTLAELIQGEETIEIAAEDMARLEQFLGTLRGVKILEVKPQFIRIAVGEELDKTELNRRLYEAGMMPTQFATKKRSLESAFLALTD
ncbi:MAG: ATP-binding cassette domain-containing protein [Bacteroidetes bacterium]|nr:ATP-binding cassette domain-containing protein [Bacteroidota bacterium]